ncbi:hypothetical protein [Limnobacter alexandrii]|uniref:hypothetical protein n=1 Tax=Limnobacter alexandrii TaxID=2570352 RepID=UPI001108B3AC|nr:hypothetical protein [Limnobacter alexandrii]
MNKLTKAQFIAMWMRALGAYMLFWVFLISAPVGFFTFVMTKNETMGWIAAIASPVIITYLFQKMNFNSINKNIERLYNESITALKHADYYHNTGASAIALDVDNHQLSIIAYKELTDKKPAKHLFNLNEIEQIGVTAKGHTEYQSFATGLAAHMEQEKVRQVNEHNAAKAQMKTGLHLVVSDIMVSEVIVPMYEENARRWVHLLQKLQENKLERQTRPTMYPPDAATR